MGAHTYTYELYNLDEWFTSTNSESLTILLLTLNYMFQNDEEGK